MIGLEELVEAGDEQSGLRGHGGGGTQVVALELMWGVADEWSGTN